MLRGKIYEKIKIYIYKIYTIPNVGIRQFSIKCCTNNSILSLLQPYCQEEFL